ILKSQYTISWEWIGECSNILIVFYINKLGGIKIVCSLFSFSLNSSHVPKALDANNEPKHKQDVALNCSSCFWKAFSKSLLKVRAYMCFWHNHLLGIQTCGKSGS